jgi:DNA polymerase III delta subunit
MANQVQVKVCWLSGNSHDRKLTLAKIKGQFPGAEIHVYDGQISFAYLEQKVYMSNCFADKKIIILTDLPQPSGTKQTMINHLKKMIENVPDDCLLVFNGIDGEKALQSHVSKFGKTIDFDSLLEKDKAHSWVMKTFQEYGKSIEEIDAKTFVELNGFDGDAKGIGIDQLRIAILKLCSYVGRKKQITNDDVVVNSFPSEEFVVWTIFDAMDSKNIESCLNQVHRMFKDEGGTIAGVNKLLHLAS